jgi:uncharacterized membrane protein
MTSSANVRPLSPITSWFSIGLFATAVLTAASGVLLGLPWAVLLGSLAVLLPDTVRIASGWKAQRNFFNSRLYTPLRSRALHRPAIAVTAALMLTMLGAATMGSWKIAVVAIYLVLLPLSVLLQNTRGVVALGNAVLDERQRQRRDAAYRTAYLIVVGAFVIGTVALGAAVLLFGARNHVLAFTHNTGALVLTIYVAGTEMMFLPALISAWNESGPELD